MRSGRRTGTVSQKIHDFVIGRRAGDDDAAEVEVDVLDPDEPGMGRRVQDAVLGHKLATTGDFAAIDILAIFLAVISIKFLFGLLFGRVSRLVSAGPWLNELIVYTAVLLYLRKRVQRRPSGPALVGLRQPYEKTDWFWALAFYLPFAPLVIGANYLNDELVTMLFGQEQYHYFKEVSPWLLDQILKDRVFLLGLFLNVIVMAPVVEEIWFRGVGLAGYRKTGSILRAVLWTSLFFALLHGARGILHAFLIGVVLSIIRLRTGSLYCCMMVHGTHNLFALLWAYAAVRWRIG